MLFEKESIGKKHKINIHNIINIFLLAALLAFFIPVSISLADDCDYACKEEYKACIQKFTKMHGTIDPVDLATCKGVELGCKSKCSKDGSGTTHFSANPDKEKKAGTLNQGTGSVQQKTQNLCPACKKHFKSDYKFCPYDKTALISTNNSNLKAANPEVSSFIWKQVFGFSDEPTIDESNNLKSYFDFEKAKKIVNSKHLSIEEKKIQLTKRKSLRYVTVILKDYTELEGVVKRVGSLDYYSRIAEIKNIRKSYSGNYFASIIAQCVYNDRKETTVKLKGSDYKDRIKMSIYLNKKEINILDVLKIVFH